MLELELETKLSVFYHWVPHPGGLKQPPRFGLKFLSRALELGLLTSVGPALGTYQGILSFRPVLSCCVLRGLLLMILLFMIAVCYCSSVLQRRITGEMMDQLICYLRDAQGGNSRETDEMWWLSHRI